MDIIPDGEGNTGRILGDDTMKIGLETEYALVAVAYIAQHIKDGMVKARTISKTYGLPHEYFLKIMKELAKANILKSKRGMGGGYTLARPAPEISILEIIEAIRGPFGQISEIAKQTKNAPFAVQMEKVCNDADEKARDRLHKAKLSKMIG